MSDRDVSNSGSVLDSAVASWNRFWFAPSDPTMLGFMRIVTGLLVLYVHLAYSLDLPAFFSPNCWYDVNTINRVRLEGPIPHRSATWTEDLMGTPMPPKGTRREAVAEFFRNLPDAQREREDRLNIFNLASNAPPEQMTATIELLERLAQLSEAERRPAVAALGNVPDDRKMVLEIPPLYRPGVVEFLRLMPADSAAREARLRFVRNLPPDELVSTQCLSFAAQLPVDPAERAKKLDNLVNLPEDPVTRDRLIPPYLAKMTLAERQAVKVDIERLWDGMPTDMDQRAGMWRYLIQAGPTIRKEFLDAVAKLPSNPDDRRPTLEFIAGGFPTFLQTAPQPDRHRVAASLLGLVNSLPSQVDQRTELLAYWREMTPEIRRIAVAFALNLPEDKAERKRVMDYVEEWTFDPRMVLSKGSYLHSHWFHISDPTTMWVVHGLTILVIAMFAVGFCTRVTSVLTWILCVAYIQRSDVVLFGMDTMMNILMIYLMIGPSGAALSVDRLIARYRALRAAQSNRSTLGSRELASILAGPPLLSSATFATRLIQIHFCFIYAASGWSKLKGQTWWNHHAVWHTIANPEFSPINFPYFRMFLEWLATNRPLCEMFLSASVAFTLVLEVALPFLVWNLKLRPWMVLGGLMLHAGIGGLMGLSVFSLFMMVLLLSYIPPQTVRQWLWSNSASLPRLQLRYDSRSSKQAWTASLIRALDVFNQIEWIDAANPSKAKEKESPKEVEPLRLTSKSGESLPGGSLFGQAIQSLGLLRSLGWLLLIPGMGKLGDAVLSDRTPKSA